jgi:hypothetical protein
VCFTAVFVTCYVWSILLIEVIRLNEVSFLLLLTQKGFRINDVVVYI